MGLARGVKLCFQTDGGTSLRKGAKNRKGGQTPGHGENKMPDNLNQGLVISNGPVIRVPFIKARSEKPNQKTLQIKKKEPPDGKR